MGWDHHSESGFAVHPSNCAFEEVPAKSPKCAFIQMSQQMMGVVAQNVSAPSAGVALDNFPDRACATHHHESAAIATRISGKLPSLVRYAAAIDNPLAIPSTDIRLAFIKPSRQAEED